MTDPKLSDQPPEQPAPRDRRPAWQKFHEKTQTEKIEPPERDCSDHVQKYFDLVPDGQILQIAVGVNVFSASDSGMRHAHTYFFMNQTAPDGSKIPIFGLDDDETLLDPQKASTSFMPKHYQKLIVKPSTISLEVSRMEGMFENSAVYKLPLHAEQPVPALQAVLIDPASGAKTELPLETIMDNTGIGTTIRAEAVNIRMLGGIERNDTERMNAAIADGANINDCKFVHYAIERSKKTAFDFIRTHDDFHPSNLEREALVIGARAGDLDIFKTLYDKNNISLIDQSLGARVLCAAARQGHAGIVSFLLAEPTIDPGICGQDGRDGLAVAVAAGQDHIVDIMLADGRSDKLMALFTAINQENMPMIDKILSGPKALQDEDALYKTDVTTALNLAASIGNDALFEHVFHHPGLIQLTVPSPDRHQTYCSPLVEACYGAQEGHSKIAHMILDDPRGLIAPDFALIEGKSAIEGAISTGKTDIAARLLGHPGIDPNQSDRFGTPLLGEIINRRDMAMLDVFLACPRTNPNISDASGMPVLSYAVYHGLDAIVDKMLAHPDTDPSISAPSGMSPLEVAQDATMRDLLEAGIARRSTTQSLTQWRNGQGFSFTSGGHNYKVLPP